MGCQKRSSAGTALLIQSCVFSLTGALLAIFPSSTDALFRPTATRTALFATRELGQMVGALLVFFAALLCAVPQPSASACRSAAAGAAVASALLARSVVVPQTRSIVSVEVTSGVAAYFAAVAFCMIALSPRGLLPPERPTSEGSPGSTPSSSDASGGGPEASHVAAPKAPPAAASSVSKSAKKPRSSSGAA